MQQTSDLDSTILSIRRQLKGCMAGLAGHYCPSQNCGCSSVGRAPPCQGGRREFEPRHPLFPVYLWRKTAELRWVKRHEDLVQADGGGQLVIVRRPGRKRLELEIVCRSRSSSTALVRRFGGQAQILPRNWLKRSAPADSKPIKIGKRLILWNVEGISASRQSPHKGRSQLIIPASLAFGTGQHVTTAMSLRVLEQLTRRWRHGWSLLDLGTGSGILALAAKCFGAGHVTGIDNDPVAISIAKSNARLNQIRNVSFQFADVRKPDWRQETDLITANLYSDLLIEILS